MDELMRDMHGRILVCYEIFDDSDEAHDEAWKIIKSAWIDRYISKEQRDALKLFNDKHYEEV